MRYHGLPERTSVYIVVELLSTGWNEEPIKVHKVTLDRNKAMLELNSLRSSHNPDQEEGASYFQLIEDEVLI